MAAKYDEARISRIANEIAEAIEQASLGRAPWTLPADVFSAAFPGSLAALVNQDFIHDSVHFVEWVNFDQDAVDAYVEHFASINPWADVWGRMPSGSVFVAEWHRPARTFTNTEFYNDWLAPLGDIYGATGLKVDASPTDVISFPVHYPSSYAENYDHPIAEVSRRLVAPIQRAIDLTLSLRSEAERAASRASMIDRAWPSLVVDASLKLCSANPEAEALIADEEVLVCTKGRIFFSDRELHHRIASAVAALVNSPASPVSTISSSREHGPTVYSLSRLPVADSLARSLVGTRTQILIVMKRLTHPPVMRNPGALHELYGLTAAEIRLCLSLYAGRTLQEAAAELGLSYETVRSNTKAIFAKTGTNGQPGLSALLARYTA